MMTKMLHSKEAKTTTRSGRRDTQPFFSSIMVQKKLAIGAESDSYEIEADRVADQVVNMADSQIQTKRKTNSLIKRKCSACEGEHIQKKSLADTITPMIQRKRTTANDEATASNAITNQINSSRGGGSAMDKSTANFMGNRFGADFSGVRIHTGSKAIQMSRSLNAQAFTVGNDIYFNEGKYNPSDNSGKHLLAHELTHTLQQNGIQRKIQRQEEGSGLCLKSVFGGEVYFDGLTASELSRIAVINEGDNDGLTQPVVNGSWYNCDGIWIDGFSRWYKIPDHCKVKVYSITSSGITRYKCCNAAAGLVIDGPRWSNDSLDDTKRNPF